MHNGSPHSGQSMNQEVLHHVATFFRQERQILVTIIMYALAVGLFSLIIPLTVQELVNTFAFAIQPIMVVTLVSIMAGILLFVGIFKALQFFRNCIFFIRYILNKNICDLIILIYIPLHFQIKYQIH